METLVLSANITVILLEIFSVSSLLFWWGHPYHDLQQKTKWSYLDCFLNNYQHDAKFKQTGEIKLSFWTGENFPWMLMKFPWEKTFLPPLSMHSLCSRDICCDSISPGHEERGMFGKTIYTL